MKRSGWEFIDNNGTFELNDPAVRTLYFPLANEKLMSSITPDLHGDCKIGNNAFLLEPVSRTDLINSLSSRNFWVSINGKKAWSASGVSKESGLIKSDRVKVRGGLLWHEVIRENKKIGLRSAIRSYVPMIEESVEVMEVTITNISKKDMTITSTAAIPIYARGSHNVRDHRHVTSLLQRIMLHKNGVCVKPTLIFDEAGHRPNDLIYYVLGLDGRSNPPSRIYPTEESFCGDSGDLASPEAVYKDLPVNKNGIQGREAMGAVRFNDLKLKRGKSTSYIVIMGIAQDMRKVEGVLKFFKNKGRTEKVFSATREFWAELSGRIGVNTEDRVYDNWFRWVSIQPTLRKIFGCSFLPDFDYGKGGRGWRDLWQDCLSLILSEPSKVRGLLINNFSGVRIDGSNATIIGKKSGEFIADRNNISRTWMDHGVWPLLTLDLYMNETGDFEILNEETTYFRNHEVDRARRADLSWRPADGPIVKTLSGKPYKGSIFEHLLAQNLIQFFNVGSHNHVRLEGADWNDGLDMAREHGESVTFSAMYAHNLLLLADLISKMKSPKVSIAKEMKVLLEPINHDRIQDKLTTLEEYFTLTRNGLSGKKEALDKVSLAADLRSKAGWMMEHIRTTEWCKKGFFNGYYDNRKRPVDGIERGRVKMTLTSQVFPVMSGAANDQQIDKVIKSVKRYLFDKRLKGFRLNTDFGAEQHELGRAFSFAYGDKENGAIFSHMVVMYANALYRRGYPAEGWRVINSIFKMASDEARSRIYPCLPEYFDGEGRGMYSYLTGSASWYILTVLTQIFGVRGKNGDLYIEPKLDIELFKRSPTVSVNRIFAGRRLRIHISNPEAIPWNRSRIIRARLDGSELPIDELHAILVLRSDIAALSKKGVHSITIALGRA